MKHSSLSARGMALPVALFLVSFSLFVVYLGFANLLTADETYVAYAVLYLSILLLFFVFVRGVENSTIGEYGFRAPRGREAAAAIVLAMIMIGVFALVAFEPGFVFGFSHQAPPSLTLFGFFLLTSPLVALSQEAVFRGYIMKRVATNTTLTAGLLVSSALFAIQSTNPFVLGSLGSGGLAQYLFSNTFGSFALGIVMGLYFFRSGWSLLGPVIVRWGLLLEQNLSPITALSTGWEFTFVFQLIGFAAMIILVNAFVREPRLLAKKYLDLQTGPKRWRFLKRARWRGEARRTLRNSAIFGIIVISAFVGFQAISGSSLHLVAIPTGSMRPTINPGSLVVVEKTSAPGQIQVGDIIEFTPSWFNGSVVHRVVAEKQSQEGILYTTKGDNNTSPDPLPVTYDKVFGKVVFTIPYLGLLVLSPQLDVVLIVFLFISSVLGSSLKSPKPRIIRRSVG